METRNFEIPDVGVPTEPQAFSAARTLLLLTLFAAPLPFGSVFPWAWASLTVLTLAVLILWMAGSLRARALRIGYTPLYVPALLFLALGAVQWCFHLTIAPIETREALLKLATDVLLLFLVVQLFSACSSQTWRRLGTAVLAYGFFFSVFSILQFLWNPNRILWVGHDLAGPFGPYVDRDHYAGLMEMVVPVSACTVLSRPKRDPLKALLWFAIVVQVVSLLLTGSRGGLISVLAETAILGWILARRDSLPHRKMRVAITGLALAAVAALFFWLVPGYVLARFGAVHGYVSEAKVGRVAIWKSSLKIVRAHPIAGTGMGSFATIYPIYQTEPSNLVTEHAHNDYVEALAETGVIGGILVLGALAMFFPIAFGNLREQMRHTDGWLRLGAAIACCGLIVHSFMDFNLHIPANAAWFAFCAGLASLLGRAQRYGPS